LTPAGRRRLAAAAACLATAGCAAANNIAKPLQSAPEPAVSPPAAASPAGTVLPLNGDPEGVAVDADGVVAVNVRDPDGLVLFDLADPLQRRMVSLPGAARHLALAGPRGPLLVPDESDDRLVEVALPSGEVVRSLPVGRQPHDAAAVAGGSIFVGDELANTIHVINPDGNERVARAPLQPGGVAALSDGSVAVVVGVRGRQLSAYRPDGSLIGSANSGAGPTHVVAGSDGIFWVADTNGGAVLGFRILSHGPRQVARIPVGQQPYGMAYDPDRKTLWVTLTATNQVVGLALSGTTVEKREIYPTVRQPNTVSVYDLTGEIVVTGSTSRGAIELIGLPVSPSLPHAVSDPKNP
jgi:DNA-binding beta-propeller fold protein YncE